MSVLAARNIPLPLLFDLVFFDSVSRETDVLNSLRGKKKLSYKIEEAIPLPSTFPKPIST